MSWIEDESDRIKRGDERNRAARERSAHKATVLKKRMVEVWTGVANRIAADLATLNAKFSGDERRQIELQEIPALELSLKRKSGRLFQVIVRMSTDGRSISIRTRELHTAHEQPVDTEDVINVDLDESDRVVFRHDAREIDSLEGVSEVVFKPFLQLFRIQSG
jgi:hypothetical protein